MCTNNAPLQFTCSSIETGYSPIKRFFDVTGVGYTFSEEPYHFTGQGTFKAPCNDAGKAEIYLYINRHYFPINTRISWTNPNGVKYTRQLTLTHDDFPAKVLVGSDESNPSYFYSLRLHANGQFDIRKFHNDTRRGYLFSCGMKAVENK